jgi:16S rRNA (adenine1518-N6/adenine1519-N6)-dimethyltransferase
MYTKKSLGQHFLRSERALSAIVDTGDPNALDIVLEIGPGEGVLTEKLLKLAGKVIAVEKDDYLFENLKNKFNGEIADNKLDLIHGDILEFDPNKLEFYKDLNYKLIANIPYNITGKILEKFLTAEYVPDIMVLLVQKEVGERIVARDKKESILSLSVKAYGKPRYIETVKAGSFAPAPKVDSAIISIENISKNFFQDFSELDFFKIVKAGFKSKRKKLSSNLSPDFEKDVVKRVFQELNLDENVRAEDLNIEIWHELSKRLLKTA